MNKKITILGIESSCDETAVSIVQEENGKTKILSNIVSSQFDIHKEFGGVVPELAARAHVEKIDLIAEKAISESKINLEDIDAVAATAGPGLIVCLTVGLNFGKTISASLNKPFIAWSIGGSFTPKKLAAAQVADVCKKMDVPVYLLGGLKEVEEAEAIIKVCGQSNIKSFCGKLSLDQTALLIKNSKVLLSNDTGLMHIGAAFKKSIVSFWGCTKPSLGFAPYAAASDSIEILSTISKRPCSKHGKSCKHKSLGCIKFIDSKDIEKAVIKLL